MSNQHTPGPWALETVKTSCGICHKIGPFPWRQDKLNHACIYVDYPGKGAIEAELLANARLIAAAPELLDVLQAIVSCDIPLPLGLLGDARAAIAKATGEVQP